MLGGREGGAGREGGGLGGREEDWEGGRGLGGSVNKA